MPYYGEMSMPRSNNRFSTSRKLSGNRMYIIKTRRIVSRHELKRRKGRGGSALDLRLIHARYHLRH
jgi:hypothetical protein